MVASARGSALKKIFRVFAHSGCLTSLHKPGGGNSGPWSFLSGVDQCLADVGYVDQPEEAGVASDRQVAEVPGRHDLGRVTDARRGGDGRAGGHHGMDPDVVDVFAVRDSVGDVCLGDDAGRPAGLRITTMRAVAAACFIRYAAAATWSCWLAVVSGGRMMSATLTAAARG